MVILWPSDIPVEVLAFRSDIAHTIVGFALPFATGSLFLAASHLMDIFKSFGNVKEFS